MYKSKLISFPSQGKSPSFLSFDGTTFSVSSVFPLTKLNVSDDRGTSKCGKCPCLPLLSSYIHAASLRMRLMRSSVLCPQLD